MRTPLMVAAVVVVAGVLTPASAARTTALPCTNAELAAHYRATDAGMSHEYGRIILANVSDHACKIGGYGGVSFVGGGNGTQVGAPADRDPGTVRAYLVQPGERVRSKLSIASARVYPRRTCRPTRVDGFRIYLPNQTRSQFVAHRALGCANPAVHLLSHRPYTRP